MKPFIKRKSKVLSVIALFVELWNTKKKSGSDRSAAYGLEHFD
ncbi:hypothetical protein [Neobacillus drentensis]